MLHCHLLPVFVTIRINNRNKLYNILHMVQQKRAEEVKACGEIQLFQVFQKNLELEWRWRIFFQMVGKIYYGSHVLGLGILQTIPVDQLTVGFANSEFFHCCQSYYSNLKTTVESEQLWVRKDIDLYTGSLVPYPPHFPGCKSWHRLSQPSR